MKPITEESGIHKTWMEEAKKQTLRTLPKFLNHLMDDFGHDYGTIVHALSAGMRATMHAMNEHKNGGITGFQASCIGWEMVRELFGQKGPARLLFYDHMLYPQYDDKFQKTIPESTWKYLKDEALRHVKEDDEAVSGLKAHPDVRRHWLSISEGKVPFGHTVVED